MTEWQINRGDTLIFDVGITDQNDDPLDITGWSLWMTAKTDRSQADSEAVFQKTIGHGIVVTNAAGGLATITVAPKDTRTLSGWNLLWYDVQGEDTSGNTYTLETGTIFVDCDVTETYS